ncbi:MAG: lipopolysaccharide biosynthesis protein [Beijerinckiaceae bacterium]|jgi:O-antigen/teichoic acid export membrane protein
MTIFAAYLSNAVFSLLVGLACAALLGAQEFGRFALGLAGAGLAQAVVFDWLRLAAARFHSRRVGDERPALRAALDRGFLAGAVACAALACALALLAPEDLRWLALAAGAMAILNGLYDYRAALARSLFLDSAFLRLMLAKNAGATVCVIGAAAWSGRADAALAGAAAALAFALLIARAALPAPAHVVCARGALRAEAVASLRYAAPVVLAGALYLAGPMLDRAIVAARWGYAESGYFSLAFDVGWRVLAALGAALDVFLFQLAVRAEETGGAQAAQEQAARNLAVAFALLTPAALGLWLVAPSLESALAPPDFHGLFLARFETLLPGFFCLALTSYGLQPAFQIRRASAPLIAGAACAFAANGLALFAPAPAFVALAQSLSFACACALMAGLLRRAGLPGLAPREAARTGLAALAMAACVWPLRNAFAPGAALLLAQAMLGALVFLACAFALDLAGLRSRGFPGWRRARKRASPPTNH